MLTIADVFDIPRFRGRGAPRREWLAGNAIFGRTTPQQRLAFLHELLADDDRRLNQGVVGGFLRAAWDEEPYLDGVRLGNYFTALAAQGDLDMDLFPDELVARVHLMMRPDERIHHSALTFPRRVYRGGLGTIERLSRGISWTTDYNVALFFAKDWTKRSYGQTGYVVSVDARDGDISACFDERSEAEVVCPLGFNVSDVSTVWCGADTSQALEAVL